MAEAPEAQAVVEEFLARQRAMYAGGDLEAAEELLAENVVWHVPGTSPIAGDYRGREAVSEYFRLRRELAGGAIRVTKEGEAHHEEALVQLADGRAPLGGREVVALYGAFLRSAGPTSSGSRDDAQAPMSPGRCPFSPRPFVSRPRSNTEANHRTGRN